MENELYRSQRLLLGHGALVLLAGFAIGFGFLFFLIGEIKLWPFPGSIEYQLPGTYDAWRMAHMEGIINGVLLWILASVLPLLASMFTRVYRLAVAMVVAAWTIVVASVIDPFYPDARGLDFSFGENLPNDVAFFLFYIGIVIACTVILTIAIRAFRLPK